MKAFSMSRARPVPVPGLRVLALCGIWVATAAALRLAGGSMVEVVLLAATGTTLTALFARAEARSHARPGASHNGRRVEPREPDDEYLHHFLATEYAAAGRGRAVTIALFGFDQFDRFTAAHGTDAAETAVREFGRILNRMTRKMNLSARYGWRRDTFLSVLSDADSHGAICFVERVRRELDNLRGSPLMPTVSAGIAQYTHAIVGPDQFVDRAERALEDARAAGGNQVRVWGEPEPARPALVRAV